MFGQISYQSQWSSYIIDQEYLNYEQQDQLFIAWLPASMDSSILTQMVDLSSSSHI